VTGPEVGRGSWRTALVAPPLVALLAAAPYLVAPSVTRLLVELFTLVVLATMWNLLAGFGGMVSVGQQGFLGVGAYAVLVVDLTGLSPYLGLAAAAVAAALVALPASVLLFRLRGGYFAIGTWVVAEVLRLFTVEVAAVGGGAGASVTGLSSTPPLLRGAITYWCALGVVVLAVGGVHLLLRSRLGLGLTAVRDDDVAAASLGVRVRAARRVVFVLAAAGCGAAGALVALDALRVQPDSVYGVQWSAFMIFMVVIGGIGTVEGPILGAVLLLALRELLAPFGAWYLVVLGVVAIGAALVARRGLWGLLPARATLFPTGYRLRG
jgi:branched-chain amino acid transport system permease protein